MAQQDNVGDLTQPRDAWLRWVQEHRIGMNRHRETCRQSISECRAAIDAADAVLQGTREALTSRQVQFMKCG